MHRSSLLDVRKTLKYLAVIAVVATVGCERQEQIAMTDPLASWNEGARKQAIMSFVNEVTDTSNPNHVPVSDRIAVFDNDGTLWAERPVYFQLYFTMDRVKALAPEHPEWKTEQPFKAVLENDMDALVASGKRGLLQLIMATHAGMTTTEFEQIATEWINTAKHPTTGKLHTEMVYQPMLELLDYLRANGFKTYIVSAGGIEFMRPWTEEVYGIPPEQVFGCSIKTKFEMRDREPVIVRLPELDFIDDKAAKPVAIHRFIGRRPIASCGNSDGDLQMMQWTAAGDGARLMLYVHHTDGEREWAYDRDSHVGRFNKGLDEAREKGWTVVDMKKDWKVIFPFELE
jgi:phosphoglycolate phosphatase-like HAD superfamily hydrolase